MQGFIRELKMRLLQTFNDDCKFGYLMSQKVARIFRDRLKDMRVESLAQFTA